MVVLRHWTLPELLAALPYIGVEVNAVDSTSSEADKLLVWQKEVARRWALQGGTPRAVLQNAIAFDRAVAVTNSHVRGLTRPRLEAVFKRTGEMIDDAHEYSVLSGVATYTASRAPYGVDTAEIGFKSEAVMRTLILHEHSAALQLVSTSSYRSGVGVVFEAIAFKLLGSDRVFRVSQLRTGRKRGDLPLRLL
jgi:hypothetical protein